MKKRPAAPAAARANYRLGLCYENIGEKEKAIGAYEKTVELLPGSLWAEYSSERLASLSPPASAPAEALPAPVE
jgi:tetratricopeptide (TPR) repeat protein